MKNHSIYIAIAVALCAALPGLAEEKTKPVRTGKGIMTFDTVPGWVRHVQGLWLTKGWVPHKFLV